MGRSVQRLRFLFVLVNIVAFVVIVFNQVFHHTVRNIGISDNIAQNETDEQPDLPLCKHPPGGLVGKIFVNMTSPESLSSISSVNQSTPPIRIGGRWRPGNCSSRTRLAVVMSYRDRSKNLKLILQHLHPFLQKQLIAYQIFVIEPEANLTFNRGMLKNIGFVEAMRADNFSCVVFHDLDLLPENDRNLYHCPDTHVPRHLVVAIDTHDYTPFFDGAAFGGAVMFRPDHFRLVNGYSNMYFGWGAEDDDLLSRVRVRSLWVSRPSYKTGRYRESVHKKDTRPFTNSVLFRTDREGRMEKDGLTALKYQVLDRKISTSHSYVYVSYDEQYYRKQGRDLIKRAIEVRPHTANRSGLMSTTSVSTANTQV